MCDTLVAQQNNKQWLFGYEYEPEAPFLLGINCLDFNDHEIRVYPYEYQNGISWLSFSSSFVCDSSGRIALITDNCTDYDRELSEIGGGEKIHDDEWSAGYCKDDSHAYFPTKTNIFFPDVKDSKVFYQLYKNFFATTDEYVSSSLMLNTIVRDEAGRYTVRNHDTIDDRKYQHINLIEPTLNKNKDGWWLFNLKNKSNEYTAYLLKDGNLDIIRTASIGNPLNYLSSAVTSTVFSPDNKYMAQVVNGIGIQVFDFNDETGLFSNAREIKARVDTFGYWAYGLCFSPNSRYLYLSTTGGAPDTQYTGYLYQVDMEDERVEYLASFSQVDDTDWRVGIGSISRGPDCRLYISPGSTSHWMHVIHYPDEKGVACGFQPMAIDLPFRVGVVLPNFLQAGSGCDPTYDWPFVMATRTPYEEIAADISISPNPGRDIMFLNSKEIRPSGWTISIYDMNGRRVMEVGGIDTYTTQLDVSALGAAVYIYKVKDRSGKIRKVGRLIRI